METITSQHLSFEVKIETTTYLRPGNIKVLPDTHDTRKAHGSLVKCLDEIGNHLNN